MTIYKRLKTIVHLSLLYLRSMAFECLRWRKVRKLGYGGVRVYYSHDRLPSRNEPAGGALIKCQDLSEVFPNNVRNANLLYMINSAMPLYPEVMIRQAKRNGAVMVLNQNGVAYNGWHGLGWEKLNEPMKYLMQEADHVFYQSEFCKLGADKFLGPCRSTWQILHNPVDTTKFFPVALKPEGVRILLAGTHEHYYRVQKAVEMMPFLLASFPEARLTVAGRYFWRKSLDDCRREAKELAVSLGVAQNIDFKGAYTQSEALGLFQSHHLLLHTKYNDPCPRLVVEALACGLPVAYSASGGVPELVGPDAGVGVPEILDWDKDRPPDPEELSKAVISIMEDLDRFSIAARSRAVNSLDVRHWISEHQRIFNKLIAARRL